MSYGGQIFLSFDTGGQRDTFTPAGATTPSARRNLDSRDEGPSQTLIPPLFVWSPDAADLLCFDSAEGATHGLAAWQEVNMLPAWDSRGRRVTFAVEQRRRLLLGLLPVHREVVVVVDVEAAPAHADELKRALIASLARRGGDPVSLERAALAELVKRAVLER